MTTSKIKIKLGAIEVEYEGSEAFLKEELPSLLTAVADLYQKSGTAAQPETTVSATRSAQNDLSDPASGSQIQMTTGAIASRLQVKSGPELVIAAAARLGIVDGQASFSRQRIIDQMKSATAYYRKTYVSNLSSSIKTLLRDGKLNEPSKDMYALTPTSDQELRSRLA